jgi:ATP-dependent 26S proteasome regulatory subunit
MERPSALDLLRRTLVARCPLIVVVSSEEERVEGSLRTLASTTFAQPVPVHVWRRTTGLVGPDGPWPDTAEPGDALAAVSVHEGNAFFVFQDLQPHLDDPYLVRQLRDLRRRLEGSLSFLFLQMPRLQVPDELRRDSQVIDFPLPTAQDLERLLDKHLGAVKPPIVVEGEPKRQLISALQGLTQDEANRALNRALFRKQALDAGVLTSLWEQKEQLARKEGVLEFVPQRWTMNDVGGLDVLKDWLTKRRKLFDDDSEQAEGLVPRGLLVMGVSGCGKSLSIKAIASLWNLPLFRLDMGQVFSQVHGLPEEAFARALALVEQVAPAVLWIDEIENGISAESTGADAGTKGRIFATFLTWMQEKSPRIFVAATANRIDLLPAELLRKGRFDQVFFIDLPNELERAQIFSVHLWKRGIDPTNFDLHVLSKGTKNWNGAEIEQCVVAAMVEAYERKETVTDDDLFTQCGKIVPLATTMAEQIKHIKSWAHDRALRANPK